MADEEEPTEAAPDLDELKTPPELAPAETPENQEPDAPGPADELIDQTNAQPLAAPVSGALPTEPDATAWPPNVPDGAPGSVPVGAVVPAGATPAALPDAVSGKPGEPTAEGNIRAQGAQDSKAAELQSETAEKDAAEAERHQRQAEEDAIDAKATHQEAQDRLDAKIAEYDMQKDLRDPRSSWTTTDKVRNAVAVLFGGFGAGLSAAGGTPTGNMALQGIQKRLEDETARQKFNISRASDDVVMARAGVRDADLARRELEQNEDARHVSRLNTIIAQGTASLRAQRVPQAQIDTDARIVQLRVAQQAALMKVRDDTAKNAETMAKAGYYNAKAGKARAAGAGGAGKVDALVAMQDAVDRGAPNSEIARIGQQHGAKGKDIEKAIADARPQRAALAKAATGEDDPLAVRDPNTGEILGRAASARTVKATQDRLVQYDQAIRSLEELKASGDRVPIGSPLYDKAVLAVAAVTQANASDKTTTHEAGTLKKYGLINGGAVDNVLQDMKTRQAQFNRQLRPVAPSKEGGTADPMRAKAQKALDDPNAPPAAKAAARKVLGV